MTSLLTIRGLNIRHTSTGLHIVQDVSLDVEAGEIVGVAGESGSGKTLISLAAMGLLPIGLQASGSIELNGEQIVGKSERSLRRLRGRRIAMIFQNPLTALNPFFTIGRQLTDVSLQHGLGGERHVRDLLRDVEMPDDILNRYPHTFSGGQMQRIMIAMALAGEPDLLIADEPTTALDVTVQSQIVSLLKRLTQSRGLSCLFITHDLALASKLCRRIAVMYAGRLVEVADVSIVRSQRCHPYTRCLVAAIPTINGHGDLQVIAGSLPDLSNRPEGCIYHPRCSEAEARCRTSDPPMLRIDASHLVACCHIAPAA